MKISILVAARDEEAHIEEMMASVLRQTHEDFELLVVDDRSADRTPHLVREWAMRDPRIHLVRPTDTPGKNAAWNRAFEYSSGQVVMYVGADDILPSNSIELRCRPLVDLAAGTKAASFSKLRMFSADPRFNGTVVPRGRRGGRAGGTLTMTRDLADTVFPLSTTLPNEDLWSSTVVELRADAVFDVPEVTYLYRIHGGNSFRVWQNFTDANTALHKRNLVYDELLHCERLEWTEEERFQLAERARWEDLRHDGRLAQIVLSTAPATTKLRLLAQASPGLYAIRQRFFRLFSGW